LVHHTIKDKFIKHTIEEIESTDKSQRNHLILMVFKVAASDQFIGESKLYGGKSIKKLLHCPTLLNEPNGWFGYERRNF
jgi:hypothetical protein